MNFGEEEDFYEKHRYFFQNFTFKFEGLRSETEEKLEDIVKKLSATVSKDDGYTMVEEAYFKKKENKNRTDLYSVSYILDSIMANLPLNINEYRLISTDSSEQLGSPCCWISQYILRTDSCLRFYNDNVCCATCSTNIDCAEMNNSAEQKRAREPDNVSSGTKTKISCVQSKHQKEDVRKSDASQSRVVVMMESDGEEAEKKVRKRRNEKMSVSSEEESESEEEIIRPKKRRINESINLLEDDEEPSSDESAIRRKQTNHATVIDITESDEEESEEERRDTEVMNSREKNHRSCSSINKWKKNNTTKSNKTIFEDGKRTVRSSGDTNEKEIQEKQTSSNKKGKKTSDDEDWQPSSLSSDENENENDGICFGQRKWWTYLPPSKNAANQKSEVRERLYSPGNKRKGALFTLKEKRLIITYLIKHNLISSGGSRRPWRNMMADGYLNHRSVESISSQYRHCILPKIQKFGLPDDILQKFLQMTV